MRALFTGDATSFVAVWPRLIQWIASAARMTHEGTPNAAESECSPRRSGHKDNVTPEDRPHNHHVMHERFKAKVERMIWPD